MKRTKFIEQQIAFALKQPDTGIRVDEVWRKIGISEAALMTGVRSALLHFLKFADCQTYPTVLSPFSQNPG